MPDDKPALKCRKAKQPFCLCDDCTIVRAREHIDGDLTCGREWVCWCAGCRLARKIEATPAGKERWPAGLEIDERFARLKRLDARLAAVRALRLEAEGGR